MSEHEHRSPGPTDNKRLYQRLLLRGVLLIACFVALTVALPRILPLCTPFIVALVVAMALNPVVERAERALHISRRLSAFILTFVVVSALFFLLGRLVYTLVTESISLASNLDSIWSYATSSLNYLNDKLNGLLGLLPSASENTLDVLEDNIYAWLDSVSKSIMDTALSSAGNMTSTVGNLLLTVTVSLLAVYFTVADYPKLSAFTRSHVDGHIFSFFQKIKKAVQSAFGGYLRSQLLLALLASVVMFAALTIYGQRYSLLIALALGIVDFLPIVGTIAVLVPWAAIEFLGGGDTYKAAFLLILAIGFFALRRVVEPKVVGSQTGLHPLGALLSIYAGMKISGVWGAILGPVVVMIAIDIYRSGIFDNLIADLKDLYHIARSALRRK